MIYYKVGFAFITGKSNNDSLAKMKTQSPKFSWEYPTGAMKTNLPARESAARGTWNRKQRVPRARGKWRSRAARPLLGSASRRASSAQGSGQTAEKMPGNQAEGITREKASIAAGSWIGWYVLDEERGQGKRMSAG